LAKFDTYGQAVWSKSFGNYNDRPHAVTIGPGDVITLSGDGTLHNVVGLFFATFNP
jgi:hypothetical protein